MPSIRIRFDGQVFVPETAVDLPVGSVIEVDPEVQAPGFKLSDLAASMPDNPDTPVDLAANLDHYLYGHPKRP